jgi:hypothetical protein
MARFRSLSCPWCACHHWITAEELLLPDGSQHCSRCRLNGRTTRLMSVRKMPRAVRVASLRRIGKLRTEQELSVRVPTVHCSRQDKRKGGPRG